MWECRPPVATFSAGATTRASSAGPSSGTAIWRGVFEVSDARRLASVSSTLPARARTGARRVIDAFESQSEGVLAVNGRMVDKPVVERARRVLREAGR